MHGPASLLGDDRFEDYAKNRQNFYETLHINKYGSPPTTLQKIQDRLESLLLTLIRLKPKLPPARNKWKNWRCIHFGYSVIGGVGGGGRGNNNKNPFGSLLGGLFGVNTTQTQQL